MKQFSILFFVLIIQFSTAQTACERVEQTLNNYIEGSSYNKTEMLSSAFADNATLYLTTKDGFKRYTAEEYVSWFKNKTSGEFNGRIGEILSIEVEGDIATAKVEILIPARNWRFVDFFLLKKIDNEWKIISKTATREDSNETGNKVLFVVSNIEFYPDTSIPTGNSFDEIIIAYEEFKKAGINVDFVSPKGGAIPLMYLNMSDPMQKKYLYDTDLMYALKHTKNPNQIDSKNYKAIYYVGGGSAMFDTPVDEKIQDIAMTIYEKQKGTIGAVCHGTAGIVNLKTSDGKYLVEGKRVNGFPEDHEKKEKAYFKTFPFLIKKTVEDRGGKFFFSERRASHIEVDGRLVTGQNPQSTKQLAQEMITLIQSENQ